VSRARASGKKISAELMTVITDAIRIALLMRSPLGRV
jgi:hypothetical protein